MPACYPYFFRLPKFVLFAPENLSNRHFSSVYLQNIKISLKYARNMCGFTHDCIGDSIQNMNHLSAHHKGTSQGNKWPVVSTRIVCRMLAKGCIGYLASIVDSMKTVKPELLKVHVVCKFLDVFSEDLPRLPPDQVLSLRLSYYLESHQYLNALSNSLCGLEKVEVVFARITR